MKLIRELMEFVKSPGGGGEDDDPMRRKLEKVLAELPGLFKKQANLEKAVNSALQAIEKASEVEFDRRDPELSAIVHHYQPSASVIDMVLWNTPDNNDAGPEAQEQARAFVKKHHGKMLASLQAQLDALKQLGDDANSEDWPTGKGSLKYTRFNYRWNDITSSIRTLERIVKSNFKNWGY